MYRPSKYDEHNSSLEKFVELFNNTKEYSDIIMKYFNVENYSDDGYIEIINLNKKIIYDWEKRDKYFSDGKFSFPTLGQFERKFHKKPSIGITIQCDKEEKYFVVALHNSFEAPQVVHRSTDTVKERGQMRVTKNFSIFSYREIEKFKALLYEWAKQDSNDFINIFDEN